MTIPALPSSFRDYPVIPLVPNRRGDRPHSWDAGPLDVTTIPSGLSIVSQHLAQGPETVTLGYDGLTRAQARQLEQFFDDRAGRVEGFWCPTFQHDFYAVARTLTSTWPGGQLGVREWGYTATIYPLGFAYRHIAGYRGGTVGGSWFLGGWELSSGTCIEDGTTTTLTGYNLTASWAGNTSVIGNDNSQGANTGLTLSRLLWVRFADDERRTEWAHPNHATITLRVVSDMLNWPG